LEVTDMLKSALVALASAGALVTFAAPADAQPTIQTDPNFITVSGGCGPYGWRGQWGHCHFNGGGRWGYWGGRPYRFNGCPPGFWRGPWGHCRNTPYHGNLPGGGWK
jgi:hypothetical protein